MQANTSVYITHTVNKQERGVKRAKMKEFFPDHAFET